MEEPIHWFVDRLWGWLWEPHPRKLTCPLKGGYFKRNFYFPTINLQGLAISFQGVYRVFFSYFQPPWFSCSPVSSNILVAIHLGCVFHFPSKAGWGGQLLRMGRLKLDIYVDHIFNMISLATCQYSLKHYPIHSNTSWECVCWYVLGGPNTEPQEVGLDV